VLFANHCAACAGPGGPVCDRCIATLQRVPGGPEQRVNFALGRTSQAAQLDQCRAGFLLDDVSRPIVAALKYRRQHRLSLWFAHQTATLVPQAADAIAWIPATPTGRHRRGFDQGQELARYLSRLTGVPSKALLIRSGSDRHQTGRSRSDRLRGPSLVARDHSPAFVVLVDDVITTGSSLRAGATALRQVGVERIIGLAMAVTPQPRRDAQSAG